MKIKTLLPISSWALFFASPAFAGAGWTEYATITELVATSQHYYHFTLSLKDNPSGCKDKSSFYQDYSAKGSDKIYRTLLEGMRPGLRVRVYVTGNCNLDGYSEISSVSLSP